MAARLFHIRKYRDMIRAQVRTLQETNHEQDMGRYLASRMLLLEELDETIQQLEKLNP